MTDRFKVSSNIKTENSLVLIEDDIILQEKPLIPFSIKEPFKMDLISVAICTKGSAIISVNLIRYELKAPCLLFFLPNQTIEYGNTSADFKVLFIAFSKDFVKSLEIGKKFQLSNSIARNACVSLSEDEVESFTDYYRFMEKTMKLNDNPYQLEIARNLTIAIFYLRGYYIHKLSKEPEKNTTDVIVKQFTNLVEAHFKTNRRIEFYAVQLNRTPKYLSSIIKKQSNLYAGDWINNRVILEAKALMSSTNMNIQQISYELNFTTQSSFGKYFKRLTGISPRDYKKTIIEFD
ncbi:MAG: helix-turn-helix transcriptional regulator [Labilibaculum sp.]|nr:helix-turn-helix transcriptional regulator [Labilibaculum sp.]